MSLIGKRVAQFKIKSDGDLFHELWCKNPHHVAKITPTLVPSFELRGGELGTVGSYICYNYLHDGKIRVVKMVITEISEEKKTIKFDLREGDLMELYKTCVVTIHVDTAGQDNLVTWTVEYEKLKANVPDPDTLMEFYRALTKDIETYHLKQ